MALAIGSKAPQFKLFDTDRKEVSLVDFAGKKLVLVFYPGAFTGVCTKELCSFRDSLADYNTLNAQVLAISVDGPFANKAFKDQNNLTFPVVSDYTKHIARLRRDSQRFRRTDGVCGFETRRLCHRYQRHGHVCVDLRQSGSGTTI